jgi:hypothetical protein
MTWHIRAERDLTPRSGRRSEATLDGRVRALTLGVARLGEVGSAAQRQATVAELQRTIGNSAVARVLSVQRSDEDEWGSGWSADGGSTPAASAGDDWSANSAPPETNEGSQWSAGEGADQGTTEPTGGDAGEGWESAVPEGESPEGGWSPWGTGQGFKTDVEEGSPVDELLGDRETAPDEDVNPAADLSAPNLARVSVLTAGLAAATNGALASWQSTAHMEGVQIAGAIALGGQINGPSLSALIVNSIGRSDPVGVEVAFRISLAFEIWQQSVRIPNLLLFPPFAFFPGPTAPPMTGIPVRLTQLTGTDGALQRLGPGPTDDPVTAAVLRTVGPLVFGLFDAWRSARMVTNLIGFGPVPTFAPPASPGGPVLGTAFGPPGFIS